ncbi:hypothetical protein BDZ89DRAFT_1074622 [Hymenopellis radicata]|nr:hypothetical protein BDZ89DRAFT_1074622 [Hymenopellis radicata]
MTERQRFVSATGVELSLSPIDTWAWLPRMETLRTTHGCWKDLIIPLEKEYGGVEPWRWFERGWVVSLFKLKARKWSWKERTKLPKKAVMLIADLVHMVDNGKVAVEESVTFDVFEHSPGVLHVEIRDDFEGWTAREILELPGRLWVGMTIEVPLCESGLPSAYKGRR